jgi:FMN phosphatase YigB (HAD superfamily)
VSAGIGSGRQPSAELLTIDVWDTLLRRRCHPDSVKLHVCRYLALSYWSELTAANRDPWILLGQRQLAERLLGDESRALGLDDEYRHLDVYRRWLNLVGLTPSPVTEPLDALLRELERIETAQEKFVSYPDPLIAELLAQHESARKFFLSDFYLPASLIHELLVHHRLDGLVPDGLASCEVGLNKRSGRLYRHVQQRLAITPDKHAHIGDNADSDVHAARAAGIAATHFIPRAEHEKRLHRQADFLARTRALQRAAAANTETAPALPVADRDAYRCGRKFSLLLVGFVLFTMERAIADRVGKLYFLTREGEFFLEIYRRLVAADVLGFAPPVADLLEVSRLSTFAGSLRAFSIQELMRLWSQYSVQSPRALFASLGIDTREFETPARSHGLEFDRVVEHPWQNDRMIAFLTDPEVRHRIECSIAQKRASLLAYLNSAGLSDAGGRFAIVDIGWRGTIQDNLAHALPATTLHGYYLALNRFLNEQPPNAAKTAFGPDLNRGAEHADLLDFVAPIEMICNSPNGSVTGYEIDGKRVIADRHVDVAENQVYAAWTRHFQAGVLDSVAFWGEFLRTNAYSADEIRPVAVTQWAAIIRHPPRDLAQAYFRLKHNETFGVGGFVDKGEAPTTTDLLLMPFSATRRARVRNFLRDVGWLPGLLVSPHLTPGFRIALKGLIRGIEFRNRVRRYLSRSTG